MQNRCCCPGLALRLKGVFLVRGTYLGRQREPAPTGHAWEAASDVCLSHPCFSLSLYPSFPLSL